MQNVDDTITIEVKNRLDDLFGETADESLEYMNGRMQDASPLKDLKAALLSLDWEITEDVMSDFVHQVDLLRNRFQKDRLLSLFLQLLGSVGKYVQAYKGRSHPQAFKLLNTAFNRLEEVMTFPDLKEADKKRYLYAEIIKFKELREKIGLERTPAIAQEGAAAEGSESPPPRQVQKRAPKGGKGPRDDSGAKPAAAKAPALKKDGKSAPPVFYEVSDDIDRGKRRSPKSEATAGNGDAFAPVFSRNQAPAQADASPSATVMAAAEVLAALEEIKTILREEFAQLKAQMRSLSRYR
jgi:hypothetical protein